jgi:hypothetical protein
VRTIQPGGGDQKKGWIRTRENGMRSHLSNNVFYTPVRVFAGSVVVTMEAQRGKRKYIPIERMIPNE